MTSQPITTTDERMLTRTEVAQRLGVSRQCVTHYIQRAINPLPLVERDGRACVPLAALEDFDPRPMHTARAQRRQAAIAALADGQRLDRVARRYGYTPLSLREVIRHSGIRTLRARAGTLASRDTARLLGIDATTAADWAALGLFRCRRTHGWYLTTRRNLIAWLRTRESFVRVTPAQITDPLLAAVARMARIQAQGRWWSANELARELGYHPRAMRKFCQRHGWPGKTITVGHKIYTWIANDTTPRQWYTHLQKASER